MKRLWKLLSVLGFSSLLSLSACGPEPSPVLLLQLTNVPQNLVHVVLDVTVPTSQTVGHQTFTRDTTNSYVVGRVMGLMPPGPANPSITLALDLPTGTAGQSTIAVKAETGPMMMGMPGSPMPMPMETAWSCARINILDGQVNTVSAAFAATQMPCP